MKKAIVVFLVLSAGVAAGCSRWNRNAWLTRLDAELETCRVEYENKHYSMSELDPSLLYHSPQYEAILSGLHDIEKRAMDAAERLSRQAARHYVEMNATDQTDFRRAYRDLIARKVRERNKYLGSGNMTPEYSKEQSYIMVIRTLILSYQELFHESYRE